MSVLLNTTNRISYLALLLALILPTQARGQPRLRFERISLEHGLSQSIVRTIVQDSKGFLWFGTQDGLNKYDGFNFTVYKHDPFDSTSISITDILYVYEAPSEPEALWIGTFSGGLNRLDRETETFTRFRNTPGNPATLGNDTVGYIYEDSNRNLWVATADGGLDRLDRAKGVFTRFRHDPKDPKSLSHNHITAVYEDLSGQLWIGTPQGLNQFDRETESFARSQHDPDNPHSLSYDFVTSIFESKREPGILWIGTANPQTLDGGGLNRFDTETGIFAHYRHDPDNPSSISRDAVGPIHEDKQGILWIGTLGLNSFDRDTGRFTQYPPEPANPESISNGIQLIYEDTRGTLWIDTVPENSGIYSFDPSTGIFEHYLHDPNDPNSLSIDRILSIYEDRSGVFWLGTDTGGLNKLDLCGQKFTSFKSEPNNPNSLSGDIVRAIYEDPDGMLWVGVAGGLDKIDRKTGKFTHYKYDPEDPHGLSSNNVWVIYPDGAGNLWIGTFGGGLNKLVPGEREALSPTFVHYRHDPDDPNSLSNDIVRAIYESPREPGVLWVGTEGGGLNRFETKGETFSSYQNDPNDRTSLSNNFVRAIFEDSSGNLWLGTAGGGLNKFDRENQSFTSYRHDPDNPGSLGGDIVQAIDGDKSGIIWIGTFGGGLSRFDPQTESFTVYTEQNSDLCNNVVYATLEDDHGNLWLSTNGGICKFNPEISAFKTYDVDDGLQSREFNGQSYFKSRSGEMFFGGIKGFNVFHPDSVKDNPSVPPIALTDFKLFSESAPIGGNSPLQKHISETDAITLAYWQNDISFDFVALHFSHPEENKYAHMLENYDMEWRFAGTQRTATYTNLDPGEYVFRVKGSNNDGIWNEEGRSIRITITPPFWATWAFRILAGVMLIGLAFSMYRRRIKNVRMKAELRAAHDAQMAIMPQTDPQIDGFDISGICIPANEVGGDFFDYIWLNEERTKFGMVIGDVSGKAMKSAMTAVMTDGMICLEADAVKSIKEIMKQVNHAMYRKTEKQDFTAVCIASFDIRTRELTFTNAGLCEPLLRYNGYTTFLQSKGAKFPLGSADETEYEETTTQLHSGAILVLFTDGIVEAQNHTRQLYGEHRLKELLEDIDSRSLSAKEIKDRIIEDVRQFAGVGHQYDDMTVIVVRIL